MYLYEMHQHTADCSACSQGDTIDTVRALKAAGFAGMVLTNHFYHGNTGIRRNLPWADFVGAYEANYELARAEGKRLDFDVLFGIEEGVGAGKEVLLYGITPELLYAHPELRGAQADRDYLPLLSRIVRDGGGLVFQAHPFRIRDYIPRPWETLPAELLDGVEAYNACNSAVENARAARYAREQGLRLSAGSDAHTAEFSGRFGIACPHRLRTAAELAAALRSGDYTLYLGSDT